MGDPVPRLRRILNMIPLLRRKPGLTLKELCEELGASRKEVLADLNRIFLCGVPPYLPHDFILVSHEDDQITVDFADHFARPVRLTLREALALKLAVESLPPLEGDWKVAADKLVETVNDLLQRNGHGANLEELAGQIEIPYSTALSLRLGELQEALSKRREIRISYYSPSSDRTSDRWVRPYAVVDQGGNYYLVAFCKRSKDVRSFRVDRIEEIARRRGRSYTVPEKFDLAAFTRRIGPPEGAGIVVVARFDASVAPWIQEDYSAEDISREESGDLVVRFTTGSVPWAVQKLLGYGELVEVLEPDSVRDEIVRRLEEIAAG